MKIISWNINGLRAILAKNFAESMNFLDPDILCLQEIKAKRSQLADFEFLPLLPFKYFHSAERPGYSGTAIFSKIPLQIFDLENSTENIIFQKQPIKFPDTIITPQEGRVQVVNCDFLIPGGFFLINIYTPNSGSELARLNFRHKIWDPQFFAFLKILQKHKPIIICGDFNVAHKEIDLTHPEQNHHSAGFTDEERDGFSRYIACDFVDIFRLFYPSKSNCYTWWSYRMASRQRNVGWRIDYFLTSKNIASQVKNIEIYSHIIGSDHAPIGIEL